MAMIQNVRVLMLKYLPTALEGMSVTLVVHVLMAESEVLAILVFDATIRAFVC
jgi:hypothetical protein